MEDSKTEKLLNEMSLLNNELINAQRELVKKNLEITQLYQQLQVVNIQLEQFAYIVSHDLKEPLRMVNSFMQKLEKEYVTKLDDKAKNYIHFAVDGSKRMTLLINELLTYSLAGLEEVPRESIDLNEVVDETIKLYKGVIAGKNAKVQFGKMPSISGWKTPIKILFQNLLSNALKYVPSDIVPNITIQSNEDSENWEIIISDNGLGISLENKDKIFQPLSRLKTTEEYSGTGIGLATCKKIVAKHGGEIWVVPNQEQGSTFHFTLKK